MMSDTFKPLALRETMAISAKATPSRFKIGVAAIPAFLAFLDFQAIYLASIISTVLYQLFWLRAQALPDDFHAIGLTTGLLFVAVAGSRGHYDEDSWYSTRRRIAGACRSWLAVAATIAMIGFFLKVGALFSRGTTVVFLGLGLVMVIAARTWAAVMIRQAFGTGLIDYKPVAVVVVGSSLQTGEFSHKLARHGRRIAQTLSAKPFRSGAAVDKYALRLVSLLQASNLRELIIAAPTSQLGHARRLADHFRIAHLKVRLLLDDEIGELATRSSARLGGKIAVEMSREPIGYLERWTKRIIDIVISGTALIVLSPFLLLVALAIRLETPGPALFLQRRDGFNGQPFRICKFRSMSVMEDGAVVAQARRNDNRVTRIGAFIRKTSIDELPQLWNVLRGEMSLVGPRPHALAHGAYYSDLIREYAHRHHVKPGLTGWAQVNGSRGDTPTIDSMKSRIDFDIWYITNWSIWLDTKIILRTFSLIFRRTNAF